MSRPLRVDIENGIYHVTSRAWERRVIVRDDRDREQWLSLLDRVAVRCGWQVFAWALLDNHLFLRTQEANLSAGMHDLNSGYARTFNRRYWDDPVRDAVWRTGVLWRRVCLRVWSRRWHQLWA